MIKNGKIIHIPSSTIISGKANTSANNRLGSSHVESNPQIDIDEIDTDNNLQASHSISDVDLPDIILKRLFEHQVEGVEWLYNLHDKSKGGILGDDMGLGKTFQVIAFLTGLMRIGKIQRVLILAPVSVLQNWLRELNEFLLPHVKHSSIELISSDISKPRRQRILQETFLIRSCRVIVSSYQIVSNMASEFSLAGIFDYIILDEGHIIKNPATKLFKSMQILKSKHKLILTGTPIQNNLLEYWALLSWATDNTLFGSMAAFKREYSDPIQAGQDPKANKDVRERSMEAADGLLKKVKPILLRRKKCEKQSVLNLPEKTELVVWIPLSTQQRTMYDAYLNDKNTANAFFRSTFPVDIINHLKSLCRHPLLCEVSDIKSNRKNINSTTTHDTDNIEVDGGDDDDVDALTAALAYMTTSEKRPPATANRGNVAATASLFDIISRRPDSHEILKGSVKLRVLLDLLRRLQREGHRTLVFSQSKLMLDIIQYAMADYGLASCRIDGSVVGRDRQRIVDSYNVEKNNGPSVCLLTTKACAYGITLTGADRVIIFDPSWNPAEDRQAVDRAFRIGQTRDVIVYRFIMASAVEEKMYEKQVFKDGLRIVTESGESSRYFAEKNEMGLFSLGPTGRSLVMEKLWDMQGGTMDSFDDAGGSPRGVLGFTRHDTLYEEMRPKDKQLREQQGEQKGNKSQKENDIRVHILDSSDTSSCPGKRQMIQTKLTNSHCNNNNNTLVADENRRPSNQNRSNQNENQSGMYAPPDSTYKRIPKSKKVETIDLSEEYDNESDAVLQPPRHSSDKENHFVIAIEDGKVEVEVEVDKNVVTDNGDNDVDINEANVHDEVNSETNNQDNTNSFEIDTNNTDTTTNDNIASDNTATSSITCPDAIEPMATKNRTKSRRRSTMVLPVGGVLVEYEIERVDDDGEDWKQQESLSLSSGGGFLVDDEGVEVEVAVEEEEIDDVESSGKEYESMDDNDTLDNDYNLSTCSSNIIEGGDGDGDESMNIIDEKEQALLDQRAAMLQTWIHNLIEYEAMPDSSGSSDMEAVTTDISHVNKPPDKNKNGAEGGNECGHGDGCHRDNAVRANNDRRVTMVLPDIHEMEDYEVEQVAVDDEEDTVNDCDNSLHCISDDNKIVTNTTAACSTSTIGDTTARKRNKRATMILPETYVIEEYEEEEVGENKNIEANVSLDNVKYTIETDPSKKEIEDDSKVKNSDNDNDDDDVVIRGGNRGQSNRGRIILEDDDSDEEDEEVTANDIGSDTVDDSPKESLDGHINGGFNGKSSVSNNISDDNKIVPNTTSACSTSTIGNDVARKGSRRATMILPETDLIEEYEVGEVGEKRNMEENVSLVIVKHSIETDSFKNEIEEDDNNKDNDNDDNNDVVIRGGNRGQSNKSRIILEDDDSDEEDEEVAANDIGSDTVDDSPEDSPDVHCSEDKLHINGGFNGKSSVSSRNSDDFKIVTNTTAACSTSIGDDMPRKGNRRATMILPETDLIEEYEEEVNDNINMEENISFGNVRYTNETDSSKNKIEDYDSKDKNSDNNKDNDNDDDDVVIRGGNRGQSNRSRIILEDDDSDEEDEDEKEEHVVDTAIDIEIEDVGLMKDCKDEVQGDFIRSNPITRDDDVMDVNHSGVVGEESSSITTVTTTTLHGYCDSGSESRRSSVSSMVNNVEGNNIQDILEFTDDKPDSVDDNSSPDLSAGGIESVVNEGLEQDNWDNDDLMSSIPIHTSQSVVQDTVVVDDKFVTSTTACTTSIGNDMLRKRNRRATMILPETDVIEEYEEEVGEVDLDENDFQFNRRGSIADKDDVKMASEAESSSVDELIYCIKCLNVKEDNNNARMFSLSQRNSVDDQDDQRKQHDDISSLDINRNEEEEEEKDNENDNASHGANIYTSPCYGKYNGENSSDGNGSDSDDEDVIIKSSRKVPGRRVILDDEDDEEELNESPYATVDTEMRNASILSCTDNISNNSRIYDSFSIQKQVSTQSDRNSYTGIGTLSRDSKMCELTDSLSNMELQNPSQVDETYKSRDSEQLSHCPESTSKLPSLRDSKRYIVKNTISKREQLSKDEEQKYEYLIRTAEQVENSGLLEEALEGYANAMKLCDDAYELHEKMWKIGNLLNAFDNET